MTKSRSRAVILPTALAALALSCGGENNENRIAPLVASIEIQPVGAPPVVFLRERVVSGDTVFVDIVLSPVGMVTYDSFAFAFRFDPSVLQVGILKAGMSSALTDPNATPFGDCGEGDPAFCSPPSSSPLCSDNTDPGSPDDANATGMLILGVARLPECNPADASVETRLLTLALTAASVGESSFEFLLNASDLNSCRIWQYPVDPSMPLVDLGVPCDAGVAIFRASR